MRLDVTLLHIQRIAQVSVQLARLLRVKFLPGRESPVASLIDIAQSNPSHRALTILEWLIRDLQTIDSSRPHLLKDIRKKNKQLRNFDDLYGFLFEVQTAASLARKGLAFKQSESPDFVLLDEWDGIFIEVTSAHLQSTGGSKNLDYKITSAIRRKARQSYANLSTALFIDITNIEHHNLPYAKTSLDTDWKERLRPDVEDSGFGTVILFVSLHHQSVID